jgi:hypothetical protein
LNSQDLADQILRQKVATLFRRQAPKKWPCGQF